MEKAVTTSPGSPQGTRRSQRIKLIETKRKQLKRDLSKKIQTQRAEVKSLKRQQRRPKSQSGDNRQVQRQLGESECMHPEKGEHGKPLGVIPESGEPIEVKPQLRKPNCVYSRSKFIQRGIGSYTKHWRRRPKSNEKQPKPTQQLPETTEQPPTNTPVSLRLQIIMAVKISQENTPAEVTLANERHHKGMDVKGTGRTYLHPASLKGNRAKEKSILKKNHNLNQDGLTALHDACINSHERIVKDLFERGADVNIQRPNETPLFDAVTADNSKVSKLPVDHGANPLFKNDDRLEVCHFAKSPIKECLQNLKGTILNY